MSMRSRWFVAMCCIATAGFAAEPVGPGLGVVVPEAEIARLDITVMPSGEGLPRGSGDATAGRSVYLANCMACHGTKGEGLLNDKLVGGTGSLAGESPVKTVGSYWPYATTLFDYVRRAMPYQQPGSLTASEIYAVTAYLLYLNEIVGEDQELNAATLPLVEMPNREGFVRVHGG